MLSVIERELRSEARHPFTYWVRVLAMGGMLVVALIFVVEHGLRPTEGLELFVWLHRTLLCLVWVIAPLMTADLISRERREGTLGLLFLTPLSAWNIVLAKSMAHGLRAFTFCLAVLPVLAIPFLAGGVSGSDAVMSGLFVIGSLCCASVSGVLASSLCKNWSRAMIWAIVTAAAFGGVFLYVHLFALDLVAGLSLRGLRLPQFGLPEPDGLMFALAFVIDWGDSWTSLAMVSGVPKLAWVGATALATIALLMISWCTLALAARNVGQSWRDTPPSAVRLAIERILCTPVLLRQTLHRWLRWKLERNPIGWLEQRTWHARLMSWSWLAVLVSVYSVGSTDAAFYRYHFHRVHDALSAGLFLSIACAAAGSFRRERENGVLQLLLISPLRTEQIIGGRLRGLWGQFLPAAVLLIAVWLYLDNAFVGGNVWSEGDSTIDARLWFYLSTYLSTAAIGLYFSLSERGFITAALATVGFAACLPFLVTSILHLIVTQIMHNPEGISFNAAVLAAVIAQVSLAAMCVANLYRRLNRRQFAFASAPV